MSADLTTPPAYTDSQTACSYDCVGRGLDQLEFKNRAENFGYAQLFFSSSRFGVHEAKRRSILGVLVLLAFQQFSHGVGPLRRAPCCACLPETRLPDACEVHVRLADTCEVHAGEAHALQQGYHIVVLGSNLADLASTKPETLPQTATRLFGETVRNMVSHLFTVSTLLKKVIKNSVPANMFLSVGSLANSLSVSRLLDGDEHSQRTAFCYHDKAMCI